MTRVLVTHGSKAGSTAEIAEWIGDTLRSDGHQVDVMPAAQVEDARGYDAVILGGAVYNGVWHKDARRFAHRHANTLRACSLWLFSSGPLDHSAQEREVPPVRGVAALMTELEALGHVTFGGRLSERPGGFLAKLLSKSMAGDYRDRDQVTTWAKSISAQLG